LHRLRIFRTLRKAEGKKLGRPKGSYGVSKLDQHADEIRKLLSHGVAKAAIARIRQDRRQAGKCRIAALQCTYAALSTTELARGRFHRFLNLTGGYGWT